MHRFSRMFMEYFSSLDTDMIAEYNDDNEIRIYCPYDEDSYKLLCILDLDCSLIVFQLGKEPKEFYKYKDLIKYFEKTYLTGKKSFKVDQKEYYKSIQQ